MAKRMNIGISLVLCACALPWIAFGAEPAPAAASNAVQTAQQLVAAMKKAAKATGNRMAGLSAVKPRTPYRGALAVDAATGDVLFQDNADVKAHPASCTKMMTLLLVLEDLRAGRYALSDKVAFTSRGNRFILAVPHTLAAFIDKHMAAFKPAFQQFLTSSGFENNTFNYVYTDEN